MPFQEYYVIREYLVPAWLLFVQACITIAFILSFLSLGILALELVRWPLKIVLQYEWLMTKVSCICLTIGSKCFVNRRFFVATIYPIILKSTGVLTFFGIVIFGFNAYRRDWLMYPKFNIISWSFVLAVIALTLLAAAAAILRREYLRAYDVRGQSKNLVMQMEMQEPGFHQSRSLSRSLHGGGYI